MVLVISHNNVAFLSIETQYLTMGMISYDELSQKTPHSLSVRARIATLRWDTTRFSGLNTFLKDASRQMQKKWSIRR